MALNPNKPLNGLRVEIFHSKFGSCSAGGISSYAREVTLVGPEFPELFEADPVNAPAVKLVKRRIFGETVLHVEPVFEGSEKAFWSYGGTLVSTSDSRFSEALQANGYPAHCALLLHDRREA